MTILRPCIDTNTGAPVYVIAAADTPALLKARADVVCDGTNVTGGDEVEINAALAAYGEVVLCQGTYWTGAAISMPSNTSLASLGQATIKSKDTANFANLITNSDTSGGNANLVVRNLILDANNRFSPTAGIYMKKVNRAYITDCQIKGHNNSLSFDTCTNINVIGNEIKDNISGSEAIYVLSGTNFCISRNILTNCVFAVFFHGYYSTISYNIINFTSSMGIELYGATHDVSVIGNIVTGDGTGSGTGFYCGVSDDAYACTIVGNTFMRTIEGMYVEGLYNSVIDSNVISNNKQRGLYLWSCIHTVISNNTFSDNSLAYDASYAHLYMRETNYCFITGNKFRKGTETNQASYGIEINTYGIGCTNNIIESNDFYTAGDTGDILDAGVNTRKRNNIGLAGTWLSDDISSGSGVYIVAASDTPALIKARADAICDGTADQTEINAGLAAYNTVELCEGTYTISASITIGSNQSLIGKPGTKIIAVAGASGLVMITNSNTGAGNTNILIDHLYIDGNRDNTANVKGIELVKVAVSDDLPGAVIHDVFVTDTDGSGIGLFSCFNVSLEHATVREGWNFGIYLESCASCNIIGANVEDGEGIQLVDSSKCQVEDGRVRGTNTPGVSLTTCTNCVVMGMVLTGSAASGIVDATGSDNVITGNECLDNSDYGITVESPRCSVNANICRNNTKDGIYISNAYCTVSENLCSENHQRGIYLVGATHAVVANNVCYANSQATDNTYDGIILSAADYCLVQGNVVRKGALTNHHRYGINVSAATCDGCTIEGNDLYASGDTGDLNDAGTATNKRNNIALAGGWLANDIALTALATQAAQTVNANATDGTASPTAIAIEASQIVARLAAGNLKGCSVAEIVTLLLACQTTGFTMSGDIAMGDKDITGLCEATFTEEHANTSVSGAVTINWATNGPKQKLTLEASTATTVTFTAPTGPCNLILRVIQHATGSGTITWPATVKWPESTAPTLTATGAAEDLIAFYYNGTNYYGCANLAFGVPA